MIFLLSDLHGKMIPALEEYLSGGNSGDTLILLGDICFYDSDTEENRRFTERLLASKRPILIVDGNHENFEYLNSLPQELWSGGRVHRLSENVLHLQRGCVYTIEGRSFFVFGGTAALVTDEEIARAWENLKQNGMKVDYVLTHDYYTKRTEGKMVPFEELMDFIDGQVRFRKWYCGHHHRNEDIDENHTVVYDIMTPIF